MMKIYTRIVMDMNQDDMPVIESESYEYDGPLALCWGMGPGNSDDGDDGGDGNDGGNGSGDSGSGAGSGNGLGGNHGYGGYGDPDSPGSPGSGTSGGGMSGLGQDSGRGNPEGGQIAGSVGTPGGNSIGTEMGGWTSSPHGNPHGFGLSPQGYAAATHSGPPSLSEVESYSPSRAAAVARAAYGPANTMDSFRSAIDFGRYGGLQALGGVMTGNPIGIGRGIANLTGFAQDVNADRTAIGLDALSGADVQGVQGAQSSGDGVVQNTPDPANEPPKQWPEGFTAEELENLRLGISGNPSPLQSALFSAYGDDFESSKRSAILSALKMARGGA
jgi:hypothetical protein